MGMLAEQADHVIGVDTHRDAHSAAAIATGTGAVTAQTTVAADAFGYKRLLRFARRHARTRRVWAIESSGSYGSGLTSFLLGHGEWVVEVDRPARPARRNGAKSDAISASTANDPMPGQAKTFSTSTLAPSRNENTMPSVVTTGIMALRNA